MSKPVKVRVRDVAIFLKGKKPIITFEEPIDGALPYILIEGFDRNYGIFTNDRGCVLCEPEDTLIVADGANTGLSSIGHRGYIGSTLGALRPDKAKIIPRYLSFFIQVNFDILNTRTRGAAVPHLEKEVLFDLELVLPAITEQDRIVRILDEAEELHHLRTRADERMNQFVPALFHDMFGDPISNEKKWPTKRLRELLARIDSGQSPVCLDRQAVDNEWGVLKLSAITSGVYLDHENKALPDNFSPNPDLEIKEKDVLFSRKNTRDLIAACVLVWHTRPRLMLSDLTFRLRISSEGLVLPEYLWANMASEGKRKHIQMLASGAAANMPNISKEKLEHVEILVPPISLQREFAMRVADAQVLELNQAACRQRLDDLFQSLLYRAFQGEL
ncbi:MAG: restriction endonuclease subunit S [Nitrososphaera sp.]|nr:restriction endonuclease subunit S [Nitrososphaera sp.]